LGLLGRAVACSSLAAVAAAGCAPPRGSLASRFAPDRARAIVSLAERGDSQSIHKLVDLLEDDDQAVRLYAILALERLTGDNRGYRYYESEQERAKAVLAWRQALRDGDVRLRGTSPPPRPAGVEPGAGETRLPGPRSGLSSGDAVAAQAPTDGGARAAARDHTERNP